MQQRALVVALAFLACQWTPTLSLSAASEARLFLRRHASAAPRGDELAELKGANPEAYAIVKALLTKRSLGLLNPRHPTASFSAPNADEEQPAQKGPEVYEQFASPGELSLARTHQQAGRAQVALPYADVQPSAQHDWMNWKPNAMSDEQMVNNVLGAVAEISGKKKAGLLSKQRNGGENALAADEASFSVEAEPAKPAAPPPAPVAHENSYLKSIDLGVTAPVKPEAPAPHENSYLKGLDLSGDMPKAVAPAASKKTAQVQSSSTDYLSSFSWDDSKPQEAPRPKVVKPVVPKEENSLMSWLGVVKQAPTPQAAPVEPAKPSNPYLMDLS